ncbi:MAG: hypothetical protein V1910_00750 [bacterium]
MNFINKFFNEIKKWSDKRKNFFSFLLALFFTILIIILNSNINLIWKKDEIQNKNFTKNSTNSTQEPFSKVLNEAKPLLDQFFNSLKQSLSTPTSTSSK